METVTRDVIDYHVPQVQCVGLRREVTGRITDKSQQPMSRRPAHHFSTTTTTTAFSTPSYSSRYEITIL